MRDITILRPVGSIAGSATREFQSNLSNFYPLETKIVAVDLSKVNYMESHGLGVLVQAWRNLNDKSIQLILVSPQVFIQELLEQTGLHNIIKIVSNEEELSSLIPMEEIV